MHYQTQLQHIAGIDDPLSFNICEFQLNFSSPDSIVQVFKDYFGELDEESIRDNFVVIYELMDETMDFGYPQSLDSKVLRE